VQLGLIGLAVYVFFLLSAWIEVKKLWRDPEAQWFAKATLLAWAFNGFTITTITSALGNLYVILLSCFFSAILWDKT
jgi:O-antigen ligase